MKTDIKLAAFQRFIQGQTYAEIGEALGVSRQRIQQIVRPPKPIYDAIRKRAENKCQRCGIKVTSGHVHHKTQGGEGNHFNDIDNLEYLCPSCHRLSHGDGKLKRRTTIFLTEQQNAELTKLATKTGLKTATLIRRFIDAGLEKS